MQRVGHTLGVDPAAADGSCGALVMVLSGADGAGCAGVGLGGKEGWGDSVVACGTG